MRFIFLVLLVVLLPGCDGADPSARGTGADADAASSEYASAYEQRLVFIASGDRIPTAAVFDFATTVDSASVQRDARAWLAGGTDWDSLLIDRWTLKPMRDPWRPVPHGPLRLLVGDDGKLDGLIVRRPEADPVRILAGGAVAEWSPETDMRLRLRRAEMADRSAPVAGTLIDLRVSSHDTVPGPGYEEIYLTDGRSLYVVGLRSTSGASRLWLHHGPQQETWSDARIEPDELQTVPAGMPADTTAGDGEDADASRDVPSAWSITASGPQIRGELRRLGAAMTPQSGPSYSSVRGWLDIRGQQQSVFGVVRHRQE